MLVFGLLGTIVAFVLLLLVARAVWTQISRSRWSVDLLKMQVVQPSHEDFIWECISFDPDYEVVTRWATDRNEVIIGAWVDDQLRRGHADSLQGISRLKTSALASFGPVFLVDGCETGFVHEEPKFIRHSLWGNGFEAYSTNCLQRERHSPHPRACGRSVHTG